MSKRFFEDVFPWLYPARQEERVYFVTNKDMKDLVGKINKQIDSRNDTFDKLYEHLNATIDQINENTRKHQKQIDKLESRIRRLEKMSIREERKVK